MSATATEPDLWPADLEPKGEPSPSAILRQQGYRLGERTRDVVFGEVESQFEGGEFRHTLVLSASYLRFRLRLVEVKHKLEPYPATAVALKANGDVHWANEVQDAKSLRHFLKEFVFSYQPTVDLLRSLLAQTRDLDADE